MRLNKSLTNTPPPFTKSKKRSRPALALASAFLVIFSANSMAATVPPIKLAWDRNPEKDVKTYEVRYGTSPGNYTETLKTGANTQTNIQGLVEGKTYYFVVYAVDKSGLKSQPSAAITYRAGDETRQRSAGRITRPAKDQTINAGESIEFAGSVTGAKADDSFTAEWSFGKGAGVKNATGFEPGRRQFNTPGVYQVKFTVTNSLGQNDPTPDTRTITVKAPHFERVPRKDWKLRFASSHDDGNAATKAFDANPKTFWQSKSKSKPPHEIQINLGKMANVTGFQYLPRKGNSKKGNITKYEFYVSADGVKWDDPVAAGTFSKSDKLHQVYSRAKRGKFIRLRALSAAGGAPVSIAELYVLEKGAKAKDAPLEMMAAREEMPAPEAQIPPVDEEAIPPSFSPPGLSVSANPATPGGPLEISLHGNPGTTCSLEWSADLITWKHYQDVRIDSRNPIKIQMPVDPAIKQRYFRLKYTR